MRSGLLDLMGGRAPCLSLKDEPPASLSLHQAMDIGPEGTGRSVWETTAHPGAGPAVVGGPGCVTCRCSPLAHFLSLVPIRSTGSRSRHHLSPDPRTTGGLATDVTSPPAGLQAQDAPWRVGVGVSQRGRTAPGRTVL